MSATGEALAPAGLVRSPESPYRKLSPGPGLPAREVASHQCARIHAAMIKIVGERGYDAVTLRELSQMAGVSTRAFYQHFEGKEECFLRTHELVMQRAAARIVAAQGEGRDWIDRLRLSFDAFASEIEERPQAARLALVEAFAAGPAALEGMRSAEDIFEAMIGEGFARSPNGVEVPPLLIKGIVAGVSYVARARLLAGRESELPAAADELLEWVLAVSDERVHGLEGAERKVIRLPVGLAVSSRQTENGSLREDDRTLILTAVAKLTAANGYWHLTVPRIRAAAGVSRRSFDAHFEGIEDCFLAALERHYADALEHAAEHAVGHTWSSGIHRAITALCDHIARDPVLAKLAFVEVFALGPEGIQRRERIMAGIVERFRDSAPPAQRPGALTAEASMGAVWGVLHHFVTSGQARRLPRVAPSLSFLALAPALGSQAANEAIRRDPAR